LSFTAGYRHTWDRLHEGYSQSFDASRTPAIGDFCTSLQGALFPGCFVFASARHDGSSYTIGLDWQADPGTLLYIVSRQGYKSGGFNIVAATVGDTNNPAFAYRPEIVRDLEVGLKADWLLGNVKGRTNLAVYNSWYHDAQVNTSALIDNLQEAVTANAARATIRGVEIENTIEPNAFSDLSLSYSFMDAHYNRYVTPLGQDLTGLPYAYAPRNKASVTARVRLPVADLIGEIWIGADVSYQDRVFAGFSTVDPGSYLPSYGLLGLRGDWQNVGGTRIELSVFATNLTNRAYRIANEDLYSTIGTATTVYGEPRMYGASLRYRF
jgi:iron complex outermembrane recepter protein